MDIVTYGASVNAAKAYTDDVVEQFADVYHFKGSVATYNDLPATGNHVGDVYNVIDTDNNYGWTGTAWDSLGGHVQSDWNQSNSSASDYIKNRTHYDVETQLCDHSFNGDVTGKEVISTGGSEGYVGEIVKVSATVPATKEVLVTAYGYAEDTDFNGESSQYDIEVGDISEYAENLYLVPETAFVCYAQTTLMGSTITPGVWVIRQYNTAGTEGQYISRLVLKVNQLQKLDSKFIPTASASTLGGVKVGTNLAIDGSGVLSATDTTYSEATTSASGLMSASDKTKLAGIEAGADVTDATNVSAAGAVMRSAQASKTESQTAQVGVDANGVLWTAPGGGGGGVDYLTVQNGKICVIYEEASA